MNCWQKTLKFNEKWQKKEEKRKVQKEHFAEALTLLSADA